MARLYTYTAAELKPLYEQYKEHRKKEYDIRYDCIKSGERAGETIEIKLPKPLTIASFCLFIDISEQTFYNWLSEKSKNDNKELFEFATRVQTDIKDFQLSGAMNNIYNQQITARINGLKDDNQTVQINIEPVLHKVTEQNTALKLN